MKKPIPEPQGASPVRYSEPLVTTVPGTTGDLELDSMLASPTLSRAEEVDAMLANHRRHHADDPPIMGRKVPGEGNSGRAGYSAAAEAFYSGKRNPQ